ncbi:tripartite tricarboxylate transporter substrate-binding protein [Reyranella sp.]|uniref:tripartite tricarboxylate transporter substrate-binding protein n=1 Tax=Reyranella sp. TaxID=1929291 RepID=UPI003D11214E
MRRRTLLAGSAAALAAPSMVRAQGTSDWPKGPLRIVVPFPPGGTTDPVARILAAKMSENTGWQAVIDNKPGAAGALGAAIVAKAAPDGQTWMVTFDSHILSPAFTPNLTYKDSDLLNVMLVGRAPLAVACHPDRPYKTMADVVADAKQRPGKISVGLLSASGALLLTVYLQKANGFALNQIYYKGGGPTVQDALAGVTDLTVTTLGALKPHFRAGKLRPLGTTGDKRVPSLPDTPTLAEQGLKTYPTYSWWGVYAPAGTPAPIVERMTVELARAVRAPDVAEKFGEQIDMEILASTPAEFASFQKAEQERWFKVIQDNSIKAD